MLSIGVILVFVVYTFVLRGQRSGPIIAPASLQKNSSNQSTATNAGSTGSTSNSAGDNSSSSTNATSGTQYKDGNYTGSVADAYYGNVQVKAIIRNGKIVSVVFLQYPNDNPNSQYINSQATPYLRQEAIQAQSASVSAITGATFTSQAFVQSLSSALNQAKA